MPYKKGTYPYVAIFLFLYVFSSSSALAYLDPGTGSYVLQIAIAFLVGALFSLRVFWKKIIAFFRTTFSKKKKDGDSSF